MNIGATIKKLRKERDITQERFAEYLNVSPQAVSRWETGVAYPDITAVPAIASFFGVSTDVLFDFESIKRGKEIQEYLDRHKILDAAGDINARLELMREAKGKFPGDFRILLKYAWDLIGSPYSGLSPKTPNQDELKQIDNEVLDICQRIMEDCTDEEIRHEALSLQIMVYKSIDYDDSALSKAIALAEQLPGHFNSKEGELAQLYDWNEKCELHQEYIQKLISSLWWEIRNAVFSNMQISDKIILCEKALDLYNIIFENEDYGFEEGSVAQIYEFLVRLHIGAGDVEAALDSLEEYVRHSLLEENVMNNGYEHSSLLFRGMKLEKNAYSRSYTETMPEKLRYYLSLPKYDVLRDTERFKKILAGLN